MDLIYLGGKKTPINSAPSSLFPTTWSNTCLKQIKWRFQQIPQDLLNLTWATRELRSIIWTFEWHNYRIIIHWVIRNGFPSSSGLFFFPSRQHLTHLKSSKARSLSSKGILFREFALQCDYLRCSLIQVSFFPQIQCRALLICFVKDDPSSWR